MPAIEAVIFDIGNVLIEWNPERYYDRVIGENRRKKLFAKVDLHGMNEKIDLGADFTRTIYETADQHPDWRDEIRQWHDNWDELAEPVIGDSVHLMRALRRNEVPVFALSNFGIGSFGVAENKYPFLAEFDRRYISGHMGVVKPEAEIYRMLENDCQIAPERLLFADDRRENVTAAEARGWQVHLFESARGWAARLIAEELLSVHEAAT
ncbi:MAG: HAD family hydrolase [Paracoccaceae bacterium]